MVLFMLTLAACGGQEELYSGLSIRDANEMIALLQRNGIEATRSPGVENTFKLSVPKEQFANATDLLSANGYPRETYRSLADVFPGQGLIVSPFEQRARLTFALNQEMARTISGIDGVVSARVHVVMPELDMRGQAQGKTSAAVVIRHRASADPAELAPKIRLIVANGVQGLNYRDVSIAFFPTREAGISTSSMTQPTGGGNAAGQGGGSAAPAVAQTPQMPALNEKPAVGTSGMAIAPQNTTNGAPLPAADTKTPDALSLVWQKLFPAGNAESSETAGMTLLGLPLNVVLWSTAGFLMLLAFVLRRRRRRADPSRTA